MKKFFVFSLFVAVSLISFLSCNNDEPSADSIAPLSQNVRAMSLDTFPSKWKGQTYSLTSLFPKQIFNYDYTTQQIDYTLNLNYDKTYILVKNDLKNNIYYTETGKYTATSTNLTLLSKNKWTTYKYNATNLTLTLSYNTVMTLGGITGVRTLVTENFIIQ